MPLSAADTSWKVGKGFNLAEAKALIEFCTALDYRVDVRPDPPFRGKRTRSRGQG
jgi:hypothetical protein